MDHAEVLERLDDAFVGAGKIWSVDEDGSPEGTELRGHLAGCDACRVEYEALLVTASALAVAAPESLTAPEGARERLLTRVREVGVDRDRVAVASGGTPARGGAAGSGGGGPSPAAVPLPATAPRAEVIPFRPAAARRRGLGLAGLAIAASIVLLVLGGALGRSLFPVTDPASEEVGQLAALAATMSDLLADPDHQAVRLASASAYDGGLVLLSGDGRRLAVVSNALATPPSGTEYDCYVERGGVRTVIGRMHFAEGVAYWAGSVKGDAQFGRPGDRFVVVQRTPGATPELSATF